MPHLDGFGESRAMRQYEKSLKGTARAGRRAKIVGISAKCDPTMSEEATKAGMDHFLPKPFRLTELLAIMREDAASGRKAGTDAAATANSATNSSSGHPEPTSANGSAKVKPVVPMLDMGSVKRAQALLAQAEE